MWRNKIAAVVLFLSTGILLSGCGWGQEIPDMSSLAPGSYEAPEYEDSKHDYFKEDGKSTVQSDTEGEPGEGPQEEQEEDEQSIVQGDTTEEAEESVGEPDRRPHGLYVDFSVIEENHEILEYDICTEPQYDWEDTPLREELRQEQEEHEELAERFNNIEDPDMRLPFDFDVDYFPFDFNDDGLEDYLVCISSWEYCGNIGGNAIRIYIQEEGGTVKEVLGIHSRLHLSDGIHARFTVLNEKTDGYYAIVLPSNHILRYDSNTDWYEFHEGE